jgi:eukaryotic-like serine/threonine-protein kinase
MSSFSISPPFARDTSDASSSSEIEPSSSRGELGLDVRAVGSAGLPWTPLASSRSVAAMSVFSSAIREFLATPDDARRLGPYRCKDLLDKAGSAPVFRAVEEHAGLSLREVAIKVFDIGRAQGGVAAEGWQSRVVDEARSLCGVQHPNVIRFHTLYTDQKRGLMGIVMEFAAGVSVDRQLEGLPLDSPRRVALAVDIGINIASALAAAHEAGVVHCNVKPSNIMFTDGTHKLINFGIAASVSPVSERSEARRRAIVIEELPPDSIGKKASTLDKQGADSPTPITGTIGYVDPECLRTTSSPTASSDLYSLGATLYQCLAGDVPAVAGRKHGGGTGVDAKVLVGDAPAAPLADVAPGTKPELAKLVDALVSASPKDRPRTADAVRSAFERIRSALAGHERALPPEERGPFPGLERYEASDRDVFFGRSAEIAGMTEVLRTRGLIGLVGLSGTGKSSLVRAGVVPAIEEGALEGWPTKYRSVFITPGTDLMGALEAALSKVIEAPLETHAEAIAQQLAADVDARGEGIVIVVDQLEEIVTLHDAARDDGRIVALELLARLADAPVGLRVIVTARRDFLDEILAIDPHFARAFSRGLQVLGRLSSAAWEEVLDRSFEAYRYRFEDAELRREVLADLRGRESAMPLVQFGLTRLWAARDQKKKTITRAAFSAKGGTRGALEQHAGATVAALKIPQETLRDMLLAMTTPEGTRAHVEIDALVTRFGEPAREAISALKKARLLAEEKNGVTFVHDSILREWGLVRGWLEEARDDRLLSAHLERDAARWSESRDVAELWRKGRLSAGLELRDRKLGSVPVSATARTFLKSSASEERKVKVAFWTLGVLVVTLIVGGALFYAKLSRERADQARRDADALAAALAEVQVLKRQTEEQAMEAATTAALLADLQKKMEAERSSYGSKVNATIKKVVAATSLEGAQKATDDLKGPAPAQNPVIPVPLNLAGLSPSGPSAGTFDSGAIERVVNTRKAGVKRTCLERSTSTASSTKVTATLTIAPSGTVQDVTSTSNEPAVAKCIEQQMRSWTFPPPGEVKTVQIPFVFVRQ